MAVLFDTLEYINGLRREGIPEEQAFAHMRALEYALHQGMPTKEDIGHIHRTLDAIIARAVSKVPTRVVDHMGAT